MWPPWTFTQILQRLFTFSEVIYQHKCQQCHSSIRVVYNTLRLAEEIHMQRQQHTWGISKIFSGIKVGGIGRLLHMRNSPRFNFASNPNRLQLIDWKLLPYTDNFRNKWSEFSIRCSLSSHSALGNIFLNISMNDSF